MIDDSVVHLFSPQEFGNLGSVTSVFNYQLPGPGTGLNKLRCIRYQKSTTLVPLLPAIRPRRLLMLMISHTLARIHRSRVSLIVYENFNSIYRRPLSTANSPLLGPVSVAYNQKVESGAIRKDENQIRLAEKLDALHRSLASTDSHVIQDPDNLREIIEDYLFEMSYNNKHNHLSSFKLNTPYDKAYMLARHAQGMLKRTFTWTPSITTASRGIYIHGSVGVGKSFCMDLFYDVCDDATRRRGKRRAHFHEFMLDVHYRIHEFKKLHPKKDPIPFVALELAHEAQLLCFDEFQVTDIADALILKRLFSVLFHVGVVVVSTSNRPPDALYEGGLNRSLFLPFIDTIKETCDVVSMDTTHDYRKDTPLFEKDERNSYFWPCDESKTFEALEQIFCNGGGILRDESVPVMMGRKVQVTRANENCAWFDFSDLCHQPLGAADYISLANRFDTIIVEHVPQLGANHYNEARRFVTLIDTLYEARSRLVISAQVSRENLFVDFDASVSSNDGDEEIVVEEPTAGEESWVSGEGGSSSSNSTTMIKTTNGDSMEWSATGRVGVSLAQLSGVQDVAFSFRRAESRLAEMSGSKWQQ